MQFLKMLVSLVYLLLNCFVLNEGKISISPAQRDAVFEFFNNCKCVVFYLCDENYYIKTDGQDIVDVRSPVEDNAAALKRIECSDILYNCCRERTNKPTASTTSTSTTTETSLRFVNNNTNSNKLKCGEQRTAILNVRIKSIHQDESLVLSGEIPWIVAIFRKKRYEKIGYDYKCAGSLIHPKVVLTGTHCILAATENDIVVHAPVNNKRPIIGIESDNERQVSKLILHPNYYSGALHNDIGLIILKEPYSFKTSLMNKICLPKMNQNFNSNNCIAVGWGVRNNELTEYLKKVFLPIVGNIECETLLRNTELGPEFNLHQSFICAGGVAGSDTCDGDGGAPLMCKGDHNRYIQVGIVSWGVGCGKANVPGVYTAVAKFRNWIVEELRNNFVDAHFG